MDVSMSIASAMQELSVEMKNKSFRRMARSGMNIGRDAIGTMTNTLILAYVGSSLAIILLFTAYNRNILLLLNLEMIVVEVIQAIVGSIGILLAVPVTVLFAAWIFNKNNYNKLCKVEQ
ncbi:YibE/F family protein [Sedimentibacter sp. zth1]|nr:YibE/F family protein [Sedimentibacter sp. zth1]